MFSNYVVRLCLLGVFVAAPGLAMGCSGEAITLSTQQQINGFSASYPGCATPSSLRIQETTPGDITSLDGLADITEVLGDL